MVSCAARNAAFRVDVKINKWLSNLMKFEIHFYNAF